MEQGRVAGGQFASKDPVLLGVFPYRGLINTDGVPLPACNNPIHMSALLHDTTMKAATSFPSLSCGRNEETLQALLYREGKAQIPGASRAQKRLLPCRAVSEAVEQARRQPPCQRTWYKELPKEVAPNPHLMSAASPQSVRPSW